MKPCGALKRRPIRLTPRLRDFLLTYAYPGNIRELRNVIYRISCLAGDIADVDHLPVDVRPVSLAGSGLNASAAADSVLLAGSNATAGVSSLLSLSDAKRAASDEAEKAFLERGLHEVGGTVAELARRVDMNRSHLQMLLKKHGLHSKDFRNHAAARGARAKDDLDDADADTADAN